MSPEDKKALQELVEHGAALSKTKGNIISLADDGLYAGLAIEETDDGVYQLYYTDTTGEKTEIGEPISIPKAFKAGSVEVVEQENQPYEGAHEGDRYIDIVIDDVENEKEAHLYIPVSDLVDQVIAGNGIAVDGSTVSLKIAEAANGLTVSEDGLSLAEATEKNAGAMSAKDKLTMNGLSSLYKGQNYEIVGVFNDTRVNISDDEIRLMFPKGTPFTDQSSGSGSEADKWYFGIRFFAPNDKIDGYKEGPQEVEDKLIKFDDEFSGTDKYGRKYSVVWFPAAHKVDGEYKYFGDGSSENGYIGWWHTIEWYVGETCVGSNRIRINLSNETCHNNAKPYYMSDAAIMWSDM